MPLRDHFHPPLSNTRPWDGLHGAWPTMIVADLNQRLPTMYSASPHVHLGAGFEIDVATFEGDHNPNPVAQESDGGAATAVWSPPKPTLAVAVEPLQQDEYEVRVMDSRENRLVAAIEIVSPANKDRDEHRRAFTSKCTALLQQGVSVSIIDLVTSRRANLYSETLDLLGESDPSFSTDAPSLYAITCRWRRDHDAWKLESWAHPLAVGTLLPTLPVWLSANFAVPLELEQTYEETCRILRVR